MPEAGDSDIKLFGRRIALLKGQTAGVGAGDPNPSPAGIGTDEVEDACGEITKVEDRCTTSETMETPDHKEPDASSNLHRGNEDDSQATREDERTTEDTKIEQKRNEANGGGQGKVLTKPDKVLPCARCNSLKTKFCYYNNYNVNQPRHFCKNCQRYWTAGGTMRNVPVGAGRRKNKHSVSHSHHMLISCDAMPSPQLNTTDSINNPVHVSSPPVAMTPVNNDGAVQNFVAGESKASVHNMNEPEGNAEMGPASCGENGDEPSCASSLTAVNGLEDEFPDNAGHVEQNVLQGGCNGFTPMHHMHYPSVPWTCPWGPGWNNIVPMAAGQCSSGLIYGQDNGNTNPFPLNPPPLMAASAFCAPPIPFPFLPAFFWGCMSSWPNGMWNVPLVGPSCSSPSPSAGDIGCSGLGKHCRDTSLPGEEETEKSLWVPKTLRIDDPDEAAKSSIWATLGIKPDSTTKTGGMFRAFQPKIDERKDHLSEGKQVLHANPAALSRSQAFQENT